MEIDSVGVAALVLGLLTLVSNAERAVVYFAVSGVFGASAALKLPAIGGASIPVSHLLMAFLVVAGLREREVRACLLGALTFPRAGFWLLIFALYSIVTAFFMPRMFAGDTVVFVLARAPIAGAGVELAPLLPRPTNITQAVYMIGGVVAFAFVAAMIMAGYARSVVLAVTAAAITHVLLAFVDLAGHIANVDALAFVRNGNYAMLTDNEIKGFKRICGGFAEAGAFTFVAVGFYAFSLQLWLHNVRPKLNGTLVIVMAVVIILATSTTAYVTFLLYSLIVYAECITRMRMGSRRNLLYLSAGPVAVGLLVMGLMLIPAAWSAIANMYDATVAHKLQSQSGVERSSWNSLAVKNFFDTVGLGAGLGSVRTSSFLVALVSNVGVIGTLLYSAFFVSLMRPQGERAVRDHDAAVRCAARSACIAIFISASITLGNIDLGIFFSIFAALGTTRRSSNVPTIRAPVAHELPTIVVRPLPQPT